jgi:Na+/melibiose symporter-like transporter
MHDNRSQPPLTPRQVTLLSVPSLALAAIGLPLAVQLPDYYAAIVGLPLWTVGLIFMVARLVDIALDPIIGARMDKTATPYGRFRPWLLASMVPLLLGVILLFFAGAADAKWRLFLGLGSVYIGFSMGVIAQTGWMAALAGNNDQRAPLFAAWQGANILGMLLILTLPALAQVLGYGREGAITMMGFGLLVLIPASILICVKWAPEPAGHTTRGQHLWATVLKHKPLRALLIADLATGFAGGCLGALFQFLFADHLGFGRSAGLMLLVYFIAGLVAAPMWALMARDKGEIRTLLIACLWSTIGIVAVSMTPKGVMWFALLMLVFAGLAYAAPAFLIRAGASRRAAEIRDLTGQDCEATVLALVTMTAKLGYALAIGVSFGLLQWGGYVAQNPLTHGLQVPVLFALLPLAGNLVAAIALWPEIKEATQA